VGSFTGSESPPWFYLTHRQHQGKFLKNPVSFAEAPYKLFTLGAAKLYFLKVDFYIEKPYVPIGYFPNSIGFIIL
jgi:hypothetical protein